MTLAKVMKQDGMLLAKVKEQDGMVLAKVKEQDGMMLAKVKEQDGIYSACKSKSPKYPYTQRIKCCHDLQQMRNPLPIPWPFATVNCFIRHVLLFNSSR